MSDDEPNTDLPEDDEGVYERLVSHDSAQGFHRHERFAHTERLASQGRRFAGEFSWSCVQSACCVCVMLVVVLSAMFQLWGILQFGYSLGGLLGSFLLVVVCLFAKSHAHAQQTPPTP